MDRKWSHSQAGQDLFVYAATRKTNGTFLEIGGCHPTQLSNTYALEQMGWRGFSFDFNSSAANLFAATRPACKFIVADVTLFDWEAFLSEYSLAGGTIDYLSFDVDEASLATLKRFPFNKIRFNVLTVEHDKYRFGQGVADQMRAILAPHGYNIICKDIKNGNNPFEDWYVHKDFLAANSHIEFYRANSVEWTDVVKLLIHMHTNVPNPANSAGAFVERSPSSETKAGETKPT
jgi:hypothetical protein